MTYNGIVNARGTFFESRGKLKSKELKARVLANKTSPFCFVNWKFSYGVCKTFETSVLNVNNYSFISGLSRNGPQDL